MPENLYAFDMAGDIFRLNNTEIFNGLAEPKTYEKNAIIYQQGDEAEYVYYLRGGKVQIYLGSPNGAEKTLAVFAKGSLFGKSSFFDGMPRTSSAKALLKSESEAL